MPTSVAPIWPEPYRRAQENDSVRAASIDPTFDALTYQDLSRLPAAVPIIDGLLFADSFTAIIGAFSTFKSFLALDLALHVATGLDWNGHAVTRGAVIYICGEGGSGIRSRVEAWATAYGTAIPDRIRFIVQGVVMTEAEAVQQLERTIDGLDVAPSLVIFDTVARCFRGNENAAEDMTRFVAGCDSLRRTTGAAVVVVHHTGWAAEHSRGSTVLPAALDTEMTLTRDGDRVTIRCTKQKDAEPFPEFTLEFFAVVGTSSGVLKRVGPDDRRLQPNQRQALQTLQSLSNGAAVGAREWKDTVELPSSSFYHARNALLRGGYVRKRGNRYEVTETGRLYVRGGSSNASNALQGLEIRVGNTSPTPSGSIDPEGWSLPLEEITANPNERTNHNEH